MTWLNFSEITPKNGAKIWVISCKHGRPLKVFSILFSDKLHDPAKLDWIFWKEKEKPKPSEEK